MREFDDVCERSDYWKYVGERTALFTGFQDWAPEVEDTVMVGRHPHTPEGELRELSKHPVRFVRAAVAANPACPVDVLVELGGDDDRTVRADVAGNPSAPAGLIGSLAGSLDRFVRFSAASNVRLPVSWFFVLADVERGEEELLLERLAANPSCPPGLLVELAELSELIREAAVKNTGFPPEHLKAHVGDESFFVRAAVAGNEGCSGELLEVLASDDKYQVRLRVAEQIVTPVGALIGLIKDVEPVVRVTALTNPMVPLESVVERLLVEEDEAVLRDVLDVVGDELPGWVCDFVSIRL